MSRPVNIVNIGKYLFTARGHLRKELKERKHETAAAAHLTSSSFISLLLCRVVVPLAVEAMKYIFLRPLPSPAGHKRRPCRCNYPL